MKPRVLIVEDIPDNVMLLQAILEDFPADIDVAYSGEQAIEKVAEHSYAVILMDVNMPGMSGFDCVEKIRSNEQFVHVPIIFITALGDAYEYTSKGYMLGAVDYIAKPVDEEMLCSKVNIFLELERKRNETDAALAQVRTLQRDYEQILNFMAEGIVGLDLDNFVTFANAAACTLLTTTKEQLIGTPIKDFINPKIDDLEWQTSDFVQIFRDGQCHHKDDSFFWRQKEFQFPVQYTQSSILEDEAVKGGVLVFQDISERKEIENKLINLAKFDQLTGLANRTLYWEFLDKAIEVAKRKQDDLYVIFIDLDHFKEINDTLGHDAGDLLLVQASERLRSTLRSADLVSRLGGDEFAVILQHVHSDADLANVCIKLIEMFEQPFDIFGQEAFIGCSMGVAHYPEDGCDASTVTKAADTAMYSAKQAGRNNYKFFHKDMHERVQEHMEVANELRYALRNDHIYPHFQLKLDLKTRKYIGAEALARWHHQDKGLISPGVFIPIAEDTGLIADIGETILIRSGTQMIDLLNSVDLPQNFKVSVNMSAKQIQEQKFAERVLKILDQYNIPSERIELELTETAIVHSFQMINRELNKLRKAGIHISVDDFGTGYSSLAYLKRLPIDTLKVDQVFVRDIGQDSGDEAIIRAIINLAHSLGMKVLAEGVETEEQLEFLMAEGCDQAQGFLFSRPTSAGEFKYKLSSHYQ
ncbi:MAG: EAL domain-containing protein [Pseudomonadales bacterium]|nr:EAL domain-containing protein [Pseudomonadales bacterium]